MRKRVVVSVILLTLGVVLLAGCAAPRPQIRITTIIAPERAELTAARVGVFFFRTPFQDDPAGADGFLEAHLAHQFQELLLGRQVARLVEVIPEGFRDVNEAIDRARILGFDLAVLGQVQEAFWGGRVDYSRATVELRVVDVVRRLTVWRFSGAARAKPGPSADFIVAMSDGTPARTPMELLRRLLVELSGRMALQVGQPGKATGSDVAPLPPIQPSS